MGSFKEFGDSPKARMHEESMSRRAGGILQVLYPEGKPRICYMCLSSIHKAESLPAMIEKEREHKDAFIQFIDAMRI
jgi:hypothetical protein